MSGTYNHDTLKSALTSHIHPAAWFDVMGPNKGIYRLLFAEDADKAKLEAFTRCGFHSKISDEGTTIYLDGKSMSALAEQLSVPKAYTISPTLMTEFSPNQVHGVQIDTNTVKVATSKAEEKAQALAADHMAWDLLRGNATFSGRSVTEISGPTSREDMLAKAMQPYKSNPSLYNWILVNCNTHGPLGTLIEKTQALLNKHFQHLTGYANKNLLLHAPQIVHDISPSADRTGLTITISVPYEKATIQNADGSANDKGVIANDNGEPIATYNATIEVSRTENGELVAHLTHEALESNHAQLEEVFKPIAHEEDTKRRFMQSLLDQHNKESKAIHSMTMTAHMIKVRPNYDFLKSCQSIRIVESLKDFDQCKSFNIRQLYCQFRVTPETHFGQVQTLIKRAEPADRYKMVHRLVQQDPLALEKLEIYTQCEAIYTGSQRKTKNKDAVATAKSKLTDLLNKADDNGQSDELLSLLEDWRDSNPKGPASLAIKTIVDEKKPKKPLFKNPFKKAKVDKENVKNTTQTVALEN